MRPRMFNVCSAALLAALAFAALPGARAEVDLSQVPAGSNCILYLEVSRFTASAVGKVLLGRIPDEASASVGKFRDTFGFDPFKDIDALTFFGNETGKAGDAAQTSIIVSGKFDQAKLIDGVKKQSGAGYRTEEYQGHTIHVATLDGGANGEKPAKKDAGDGNNHVTIHIENQINAPFIVVYRDGLIVLGESLPHLKKTLDVLDGRAQSMAKPGASPLLPPKQASAYLIIGATSDVWKSDAWKRMMNVEGKVDTEVAAGGDALGGLQLGVDVDQAGFSMGEAGGQMFFTARLKTKDAQTATNLKAMADGLRALMVMSKPPAPADTPEGRTTAALTEALAGLQITVDGAEISASLRIASDKFVQMLDTAAQQAQPKN